MDALIAARTALPLLPDDCVRTTAAVEALVESLATAGASARRLTLVCAPTGYGKSTALAAAVERAGREPAYARVGEQENEGTRFWGYVAAALAARYDGLGERSAELLSHAALAGIMGGQPDAAHESFVISLLNECADYGDSVVIAIDDFHEITAGEVVGGFGGFLREAPPNVHTVLLTRHEPDLDLHRLRSRGELSEIGPRELAFTADQCREFVSRQPGGYPSQAEALRLRDLTDGWPAGLRLALLAPQAVPAAVNAAGDAAAGDAASTLSEFLSSEILAGQPESVREYLTATSILPLLSETVCAKVAAPADGVTLASLARQGMFIVREGPHAPWYRYAAPFARMLRRRLDDERTPRQIAALHRRAARAYADEGLFAEALHHAFEAADTRYAADLLEQRMADLLNSDRNAHLTAYLGRIPDELVRARPHLAAAAAMMLVVSGRGGEATGLLDHIEEKADEADEGASAPSIVRGVADAIRGLAAVYAGDLERSEACGRRALEYLPFDAVAWRAVAAMVASDAEFLKGRIDVASDGYSRALAMCRTHRLHFLLMIVALRVLRAMLYLGRLDELDRLSGEFLSESRRIGFANSAHEGQIRGFQAALAVLRHRPDAARDLAQWCAESAESHRSMLVFGLTRMRLAEAYYALGELDRMRAVLDEASERLAAHPLPIVDSFLFAWRVRLEVTAAEQAGRRPDRALELIGERGLDPESPIRVLGERELFAAARAYRLAGMTDEAKRLLERLRDFCDGARMTIAAMEARILWSLTVDESGDRPAALSALSTAVEQLAPLGAVEPFLAEGAPVKRLLAALIGTPAAPAAATELLARFDGAADAAEPRRSEPRLLEPLSRRELEVLRLVSEGRSNAEIADALFVSLNTVKWHTGNIYRKLDVDGRTAAVACARDLGLLE